MLLFLLLLLLLLLLLPPPPSACPPLCAGITCWNKALPRARASAEDEDMLRSMCARTNEEGAIKWRV